VTGWLRDVQLALGRRWTIAAFAAVAAGGVAFATGLGDDERPATFAALIASWLFFAGLAAGALAFRALFQLIDARWARSLSIFGGAAVGFAPVALLLVTVIAVGARLAPWLHADPSSTWMSTPVLVVRELALTAILFACGYVLRRREQASMPTGALAALYCIAFAIVLSIWAFDVVLGADQAWESTLVGPFVFVGAFLAGTGLVTLLALRRGMLAERARGDAAKLVLALAVFWAYLFWSQYLTIWYGNLPDEAAFALRRAEGGWGVIVLAVIALVFALPFASLLHPAGRRSSRWLSTLLVLQLVGLWLVCQLLIVPSLTPAEAPAIDARDLLVALGLLGAFALSVARGLERVPTSLERTSP